MGWSMGCFFGYPFSSTMRKVTGFSWDVFLADDGDENHWIRDYINMRFVEVKGCVLMWPTIMDSLKEDWIWLAYHGYIKLCTSNSIIFMFRGLPCNVVMGIRAPLGPQNSSWREQHVGDLDPNVPDPSSHKLACCRSGTALHHTKQISQSGFSLDFPYKSHPITKQKLTKSWDGLREDLDQPILQAIIHHLLWKMDENGACRSIHPLTSWNWEHPIPQLDSIGIDTCPKTKRCFQTSKI